MLDIPAPDDPRILVEIPVSAKGGKTITLRVPRLDFIDETQHETMTTELDAIDKDTDLSPRKRTRNATLVMLKPFTTATEYKQCEAMVIGQLAAIRDYWIEQSNITLGEYLASAQSSTIAISEAPSDTTSTSEGGAAPTLGAA